MNRTGNHCSAKLTAIWLENWVLPNHVSPEMMMRSPSSSPPPRAASNNGNLVSYLSHCLYCSIPAMSFIKRILLSSSFHKLLSVTLVGSSFLYHLSLLFRLSRLVIESNVHLSSDSGSGGVFFLLAIVISGQAILFHSEGCILASM